MCYKPMGSQPCPVTICVKTFERAWQKAACFSSWITPLALCYSSGGFNPLPGVCSGLGDGYQTRGRERNTLSTPFLFKLHMTCPMSHTCLLFHYVPFFIIVSWVHFSYVLLRQPPRLDWSAVCITGTAVHHCVPYLTIFCLLCLVRPASWTNFLRYAIAGSCCYRCLVSVVFSSVWTILCVLSLTAAAAGSEVTSGAVTPVSRNCSDISHQTHYSLSLFHMIPKCWLINWKITYAAGWVNVRDWDCAFISHWSCFFPGFAAYFKCTLINGA